MVAWQTNAKSNHHERNLRDCGECEHTLDITLCTSDGSSIECSKRSNHHDDIHCLWSILNPDREKSCNLNNTSHNHGSSMDKSRNRCWTLHSIWQPDMEWEHRRLTSTTYEHQHESGRENNATSSGSTCCITCCECSHSLCNHHLRACEREVERASVVTEDEYTYKEEHIRKACHNKRLL